MTRASGSALGANTQKNEANQHTDTNTTQALNKQYSPQGGTTPSNNGGQAPRRNANPKTKGN